MSINSQMKTPIKPDPKQLLAERQAKNYYLLYRKTAQQLLVLTQKYRRENRKMTQLQAEVDQLKRHMRQSEQEE